VLIYASNIVTDHCERWLILVANQFILTSSSLIIANQSVLMLHIDLSIFVEIGLEILRALTHVVELLSTLI
jgi:hypothetical protein